MSKDAKFSAWFYRGYINTNQTVWKQTPCVCIQRAVLGLAASIEDGFFFYINLATRCLAAGC